MKAPAPPDPHPVAALRSGDDVLFVDAKNREYLRTLKPGGLLHLRGGIIEADHLIGTNEGRYVCSSAGERFLVVRPTFAHLIPNLPRRAQVIYPKDIGPILLWGDIYPGAKVLEVGAGPGALTMALLRAVGPEGCVVSYEARPEFARIAEENVRRFHGAAPNWRLRVADAFAGIDERDMDRAVIDLAEPWRLLDAIARCTRPGAVLTCYVPTVLQVKQLVDALRLHAHFGRTEAMETWIRFWHVQAMSVRPEHRMIGHTGFIVVSGEATAPRAARRRALTSARSL